MNSTSQDPHAPRPPPRSGPGPGLSRSGAALLGVLLVAQLMVILDITAVNIALPRVARDLHLSGSQISWTITSYSLIFGSLLLLGGRAADLLGRRRLFLTGLGVFTVRLARLGRRRHRRGAVRGPRRTGPRRGDALAGRALDHHRRLPRQAAREGARGLGRSRRRRRRDRRPRRRAPHRVRRLAADLLRQPPRRGRARGHRAEGRPADTRKPRWRGLDVPRRRARDGEPRRDRLRDHAGPQRRLDVDADARLRPRRLRRAGRASRVSSADRRSRCCGSSGSPTAPSAAASSSCSPRPARSSACSCSARSTSRTCSARGRWRPASRSSRSPSRPGSARIGRPPRRPPGRPRAARRGVRGRRRRHGAARPGRRATARTCATSCPGCSSPASGSASPSSRCRSRSSPARGARRPGCSPASTRPAHEIGGTIGIALFSTIAAGATGALAGARRRRRHRQRLPRRRGAR